MKKLFVETSGFTSAVGTFLDDQGLAHFQKRLLDNADAGKVMKGCGGLRKIRLADPRRHKGKRGGARVIYLHVPEADWILLLDIYDKDEKDDLAQKERLALKRLAAEFKAVAIHAVMGKE
jgi:hypothetical protein